MMQKRGLFVLIGAGTLLGLLICAIIFTGVAGWLGERRDLAEQGVIPITRCGDDDRGLCVDSFSLDPANRMIVHFRLPDRDFPAFYVTLLSGGSSRRYECVRAEADPLSASCSGLRMPLGADLTIEVWSRAGNRLLAQGGMRLTALALPTTLNHGAPTGVLTPTAAATASPFLPPRPADTLTATITRTPTVTFTPTVTGTRPTLSPTITGTRPTLTFTVTGTITPPTPTITGTPPTATNTSPPTATSTRFDPRN